MSRLLIATRSIRCSSGEFHAGDVLPDADPVWTSSWLDAGSAVWRDGPPAPGGSAPKAGMTDEPGEEVLTQNGTERTDHLPEPIEKKRRSARKRKTP